MKKAVLIISAVTASSLMATDDLASAFRDGKLSGSLEAMYITNDNEAGTDQGSPSFGGSLYFETAPLYGISAGVTFNAAHQTTLTPDDPAKRAGALNYSTDNLQEAYLVGKYGNTTAKIGRQELFTHWQTSMMTTAYSNNHLKPEY
jgi:imipenem/basic amino acid-specific outer membrane pore